MDFYTDIALAVLRLVIAILLALFGRYLLPWLGNTVVPWLKDKHLFTVVTRFVQAAEKMAEAGTLNHNKKKEYVIHLLEKRGYTVDENVNAFIESAVKELDLMTGAIGDSLNDLFGADNDTEYDTGCTGDTLCDVDANLTQY